MEQIIIGMLFLNIVVLLVAISSLSEATTILKKMKQDGKGKE